jgi:hypothetical protein
MPLPHIKDQTAATSKLALLVDASASCRTICQPHLLAPISEQDM